MDFDLVSRLLFPSPPSSYTVDSFPGELIWIPRSLNPQTSSPEDCIPCALLRCKTAQYLVIYMHSNYEDLGRCHSFLGHVRDRFQVHVLAVEYPGYGICPGAKCDERGATESALTAFRFAREVLRWPPDRIIFLGRSVGTGPAITLAVEHAVKGICLISPFLSVREVCRDVFGPVSFLIEERFPNKDHMPMIRSPCLVVHGQKDSTIPFRHGKELFESCRSRKRLVSPPEMDHNANLLQDSADFVSPMLEFFSLPSHGLEEMQVPSWAFDKRLSPFYMEGPVKSLKEPKWPISSLFGNCTACTACGKCAMQPGMVQGQGAQKGLRDGDLVEETITGAIETVLGRKEDVGWAEAENYSEPAATADPSSPKRGSRETPQSFPAASEIITGGRSARGAGYGNLSMGQTLGNMTAQELPVPPSDDAVPVTPHATVRRHAGRVPLAGQTFNGPSQMRNAARPMMSWRPHILPQVPSQSTPAYVSPESSPDHSPSKYSEIDDDFNTENDDQSGTTLIRI